MQIQSNDHLFKRGYLENPLYTYIIKVNKEKPNAKDSSKGTWEIVQINYDFVNGEKAKVTVTDESRPMIKRVKMDDENRLRSKKGKKGNKDNGYSQIPFESLEYMELCDSNNSIDDLIERMNLESIIDQLPEKQQRVIRLKYFEGMSTDRIAEMEGVKKSAISNREKRALETLKKILTNIN